ncbi:MAG: hypothetical protein ACXVFV_07880, partial [Mycobacteriales bacterium]
MRLAPAARRTVATVAATTLLTAGGVLTGALVGVASAQAVSSVSPTNVLNNGAKTFTLNGSGFVPGAMTVVLHRHVTVPGQGDVKGTFAACAGLTCTTTESFSAPLANVAPGVYDVVLTNTATSEVDKLASAVTVTAVGSPTLTSVAHYVNGTTPADGDLELTGTNLSQGSVVQFLKADGTVDSGLSFTPSLGTTSGYVSSTTLRGHYTATTAATPGLHALKVVDAVNQSSNTLAFYQPQLDGTSQPTIGQGANAAALSVLGQGFNPSSTYTISTPSTPDLTVSSPVSVTSTSVTENVTVKANAATTARTITVRGPDGGFATRSDLLSITAGPAFSAGPPLATAPLNPSVRGQGSTTDVVVTGSGFTGGTTFDFGQGTSSPRPVKTFTSSTSVVVTVPVADTAPTGTRNVVATNADDGT